MKKIIEEVITTCDVCDKTKESPIALSGFSTPTWYEIAGFDLCYVCYHTLADRALRNLIPEQTIKNEIKKMKDNKQ